MYTKDKRNTINIRIDNELKNDINTYSKKMGMSISEYKSASVDYTFSLTDKNKYH